MGPIHPCGAQAARSTVHSVRSRQNAETNARLRKERASDALLLGEAHELANKLAELRGTISLVDADLQANQLGRDEAERGRSLAEGQLVAERGFQVRAKRAENELTSVRNELTGARTALETMRAELLARLEESEQNRNAATAAYQSLLVVHDQLVVQSQSSYTDALLRAEEAESLVVVRNAELERLTLELAAIVRRSGPVAPTLAAPTPAPNEAVLEPLSVVIDLRNATETAAVTAVDVDAADVLVADPVQTAVDLRGADTTSDADVTV